MRFFKEHGHCLKEGVAHDYSHREALAKLLRFESSATESGKFTSLADYVMRMPEEQKEIYFLSAANREACEAAPSYEVFREKKWEMLFLSDARDEFVLESLREFDGKKLVAAEKADVKLERESKGLDEATAAKLAEFIKETVGERIGEVRVSKRLVGSPAIALSSDSEMTVNMRRMMKALNRDGMAGPDPMPDIEINPDHALIVSLEKVRNSDAELGKVVAQQVADQTLAAAGLLDDPRTMLGRMTSLLEKLCAKP